MPSFYDIGLPVLEKIFKFRHCLFAISLSSPVVNGQDSSFEQTWVPLTQGCFSKFDWNWPSGSWEEILNFVNVFSYFIIISPWKRLVLEKMFTTDDEQQAIGNCHLSFQLRWAKKSTDTNSIIRNICHLTYGNTHKHLK